MQLNNITYSDKRIEHFRNTYDTWEKNLPEEVKCILLEMLKHYQYYSLQEVNKYLTELHEKLNNEYSVSDLDSLHTFIQKKEGRHNSSVDYYSSYMNINGISSYAGTTNISLISDVKWERIENIVIVDDCIGTGSTIQDFLGSIKKDLTGKRVFYITVHAMESAIPSIEALSKELGVEIIPIAHCYQKKALELQDIKEKYENASEVIEKYSCEVEVPKDYTFGFKDSRALVSFYNNTSNNTIGLFWHEDGGYQALFPRRKPEKPNWMKSNPTNMKENKNRRKSSNYNARERKNRI